MIRYLYAARVVRSSTSKPVAYFMKGMLTMQIICSKCLTPTDEAEISWTEQLTNDKVCVWCTHEFDDE